MMLGKKIKGEYHHKIWTLSRKASCHLERKHYGLGLCFSCYNSKRNVERKEYHAQWYEANKERLQEQHTQLKLKYKFDVLERYGGLPPKCACCSEQHIELLTIDHINGGGAEHRKTMRGQNFYKWLQSHDYPDGFRVLCMGCNWVRGKFGYCPHKPTMQ